MESRIMQVFYGNDCLPYKDSARSVHYPIIGNSFLGASNTTQIRFYVRDIGGVNNVSWVAVSKLPNGKIGSQVLSSIQFDGELNEYYVALDLSSYYTQLKGDVYISLNGYQGGVQFQEDEETGIYTIEGTPIIEATGAIKLAINYSPQIPLGQHFNINDLQQILGLMSEKANVINTIQVVADIETTDLTGFDDYQLFYDLQSELYYRKLNETYQLAEGIGILGNSKALIRINVNANTTIEELFLAFGSRLLCINAEHLGRDFLLQTFDETTACAFWLDERQWFYSDNAVTIGDLIQNSNVITYVEKKTDTSCVYATNGNGQQIMLPYSYGVLYSALVQRTATGQIKVPLVPNENNDATSKKYIDDIDSAIRDLIDTIRKNSFINVSTTEFPTLNDFLASQGEEGYIYLYPINPSDLSQGFHQYIWEDIGSGSYEWEYLGTTQIDLSSYATINYVDNRDNYIISLVNNVDYKLDETIEEVARLSAIFSLYGSYYIGAHTLYVDTAPISDNTITLIGSVSGNTLNIIPVTSFYTKSETDTLLANKVDKTNDGNKVYGTDNNGNQATFNVDNGTNANGNVVRRDTSGQITIPLTPNASGHATSKQYVDGMAYSLVVSMNSSTYVVSFELRDRNSITLSQQSIDLPLESVVVDGDYDDETKSIILTLNNGNTVTIPVADLVDDLVNESQFNATLQNYATKEELQAQNTRLQNELDSAYNELDNLAGLLNLVVDNFITNHTLYSKTTTISANTATIVGTISGSTLSLTTSAN